MCDPAELTGRQKTDWSSLYSPGSEILSYLKQLVVKYKLESYINLRHELTSARYDEASGKWRVRIKRPSQSAEGEYEEFDDEADFIFAGMGILSRWSWPQIEGLQVYKGTLLHSAGWNLGGATWEDDVKDWGDKRVAVIGLVSTAMIVIFLHPSLTCLLQGSSALQITAALQAKVGRLTQYARGKTWIPPPFVQNTLSKFIERDTTSPATSELFFWMTCLN